jgi:hypothetical protein
MHLACGDNSLLDIMFASAFAKLAKDKLTQVDAILLLIPSVS